MNHDEKGLEPPKMLFGTKSRKLSEITYKILRKNNFRLYKNNSHNNNIIKDFLR